MYKYIHVQENILPECVIIMLNTKINGIYINQNMHNYG